ncbi:Protein HEADING DATE 3B [Capsicum annuum]|nr:Protein HEADING DATE 3B [Capsicum annuum]
MPSPRVDPLIVGRVIGDVLDPFTKSVDLRVVYNNREINNSCVLKPSQVVMQPRVHIGGNDLRNFYTLSDLHNFYTLVIYKLVRSVLFYVMILLFRVIFATFILWLVTDIPATTDTSFGNEVVCYEKPTPSMGIHRFVLVLFRQLGRETVYAPGWRQNFNTRDFAELYNLGLPVASIYFNCHRESGTGGRRA